MFYPNFIEMYSLGSNLQEISICSDNGCHRSGDKSLSEQMMVYLTDTYMCHSAYMS